MTNDRELVNDRIKFEHDYIEELRTRQEIFQNNLHFEHDLINRRITWLLSSQTILFAAYGLAISKDVPLSSKFLMVTPAIGLAISILIWVGVICAVLAKRIRWIDHKNTVNPRAEWGVRTTITKIGLVPDFLLPLVFACGWISLLLN